MSIKSKNSEGRAGIIFSRTVLLTFIIVTVYPIIFVILTSLKSTQEFYINIWLWPKKLVLHNYYKALIDAHIGQYFLNSLFVVCVSVAFILLFGALAGYALARLRVPGTGIIIFLLLSTTFFPSEMVIMPLYIMMSKMKLLGSYYSLIIPYVGWSLPMSIFILLSFFRTLPVELLESARMDGCNEIQTFTKITAPLMMPAIATVAIFSFVGLWGELLWASISLSMSSLRTIPFGVISFSSQFGTDWSPLSAAIVLVLLPLIIFFLFVQKYFIQGLTGGAVKG
jgi:raffinose/stachyose/melibiose transport system permease protein